MMCLTHCLSGYKKHTTDREVENIKKYPEKTKSDKAIDAAHVGAQLIPFGVGGAISQTVNSFWPQGFEKRKEEWLQCLAEKIESMPEEVTEHTYTFFETEEGKTLLLKAATAAISTHKQEKYQAIRDVLLSTANDSGIKYDQKEMFVTIIADLEPYDLFLLKLFHIHHKEFGAMVGYDEALKKSQEYGFQGGKDEFLLTVNKLKDKSLLRVSDLIDGFSDVYSAELLTTNSVNDKPKVIITSFAKKLISYIEDTA